jgi:hypothetical protein
MYRVTRMVMALVALTLSFAAAQHDHSAANEATSSRCKTTVRALSIS